MSKHVAVLTDGLWWSTTHKLPELIRDSVNHKYSKKLLLKLINGETIVGTFEYWKSGDQYRWYTGGILPLEYVTHWKVISEY